MKDTIPELTVDHFPIRELSERTGVNSVTLRAWERRYGLLKPFRTAKGHRLYNDADVEQVKRILYWVHQGVAVGKVRALLNEDQQGLDPVTPENHWLAWQQTFYAALDDYAISKWETMVLEAIKQYPLSVVLKSGILPVLSALQSKVSTSGAVVLLHASLEQLLLSLDQHGQRKDSQVLVLSIDGQSLFARLVTWVMHCHNKSATCVSQVRTPQQLTELVDALAVQQVVVVGDGLSHQEAKRWLDGTGCQSAPLTWIGPGFWLARHESGQPGHVCFSSSVNYLDDLLR